MLKFILLFFVGVVFYWLLIIFLKQIKIYQPIYDLSPGSHQQKSKTPSFGGIGILFILSLGIIIFKLFSPIILWLYLVFLSFVILGFVDDFLSVKSHKNKGFSAKQKFLLQIIITFVLLSVYTIFINKVGIINFLIYWFLMVGFSNATNLTDGLDGLLGGLSIISAIGFFLVFFKVNDLESIKFVGVFITSILCFLIFNKHKAKIFMGDTGSLSIGALFVGLSLILNNFWLLIPFGFVYICETLSVILQVGSYKLFKRRIFKMAPLHHHFEMMGLSEIKVVLLFWLVGLISFGVYFLYKGLFL